MHRGLNLVHTSGRRFGRVEGRRPWDTQRGASWEPHVSRLLLPYVVIRSMDDPSMYGVKAVDRVARTHWFPSFEQAGAFCRLMNAGHARG